MDYHIKYTFFECSSLISGICIWNKRSITLSKDDIDINKFVYYNKDEVIEIYLELCKKAILDHKHGWTLDKAKKFEDDGRAYILKTIYENVDNCTQYLYEVCRKGKYGVEYDFTNIKLPANLKINNRICSDNKIRSECQYIQYLLGDDFDLISIFTKKWPFLEFKYGTNNSKVSVLSNIICYSPFNPDIIEKDIVSTMIL